MIVDTRMQQQESNQQETFGYHDQYFTFMLAEEEYGIDILNVVEIRGLEKLTAIPSAPVFVKGVLNLRGSIIPVMDLRERFNMATISYGRSTVVVVLQVDQNDDKKEIGIIVDAVSDVYRVSKENIKPKPEVCNQSGHDYIAGIASIPQENKQDKLVILLDVNKLLTFDTIKKIEALDISHEKN
jgi:purine-binding chemotaxis protein CheW